MHCDGAADVDDTPCGCQRVSSVMSPPVLPGPEETHRTHIGFARTVRPYRGHHYSDTVSMQSCLVHDMVDAGVLTRSLSLSRLRLAEKSI